MLKNTYFYLSKSTKGCNLKASQRRPSNHPQLSRHSLSFNGVPYQIGQDVRFPANRTQTRGPLRAFVPLPRTRPPPRSHPKRSPLEAVAAHSCRSAPLQSGRDYTTLMPVRATWLDEQAAPHPLKHLPCKKKWIFLNFSSILFNILFTGCRWAGLRIGYSHTTK